MAKKTQSAPSGDASVKKRKTPPALTSEGRENYLISLAYDLVEKRLVEGTATSQETTHFLKMGSSKERYEKELLKKEIELRAAKTEALASAKRVEELYTKALNAMREYSGQSKVEEEEDYD